MKELLYLGRTPMNLGLMFRPGTLGPIEWDEVVSAVRHGTPIALYVEPGDATRYELLLVPGTHFQERDPVLRVFRMTEGQWRCLGGTTLRIPDLTHVGPWDLGDLSNGNPWTADVLAAWLNQLGLSLAAR